MTLSSLVCFNLLALDKTLAHLPDGVGVTLIINESGRIIDHTAMEYLHQFQEECVRDGRPFELFGIENFYQFTQHSLSARMQDTILIKEQVKQSAREEKMARLAEHKSLEFQSASVSTLNEHGFTYLRRGDDKQEYNAMSGSYLDCDVRLFDYSHTAAPDYYSKHWHTIITLHCPVGQEGNVPDIIIAPGSYLERYLAAFDEIAIADSFADHYRVYSKDASNSLEFLSPELIELLSRQEDVYLEVRNGVMLAFCKDQALADEEGIALLFRLAEIFNGSCNKKLN